MITSKNVKMWPNPFIIFTLQKLKQTNKKQITHYTHFCFKILLSRNVENSLQGKANLQYKILVWYTLLIEIENAFDK